MGDVREVSAIAKAATDIKRTLIADAKQNHAAQIATLKEQHEDHIATIEAELTAEIATLQLILAQEQATTERLRAIIAENGLDESGHDGDEFSEAEKRRAKKLYGID